MPYDTFNPPRSGNGVHWRALVLLLLPACAGAMLRAAIGPLHVIILWLCLLLVLPVAAVASWKYSCYVAETHAQPWGFLSFWAMMASCGAAWLCCVGWGAAW